MTKIHLTFPNATSFSSFSNSVEEYFDSFDKSLEEQLLCTFCYEVPSHVTIENKPINNSRSILLQCSKCKYKWFLCGTCPSNIQPEKLQKRLFRRSKSIVQSHLLDTITAHEHKYHCIQVTEERGSDSIVNLDSESFSLAPANSKVGELNHFEHGNDESTINQTRFSEQDLVELFPSNEIIRNAISAKVSEKCYASYLIKKTWCNNNYCKLIHSEVLLFLKVVSNLLKGTRDENVDFIDIIDMIEIKNESCLKKQQVISNDLEQSNQLLMQENKTLISMLNELGIDHARILNRIQGSVLYHGIYDTQQYQHSVRRNKSHTIIEIDASEPIISLTLPRTPSDCRKIIEGRQSFVEQLCTPEITCRVSDGYAFCKPSKAMKIAVSLGLGVEYEKEGALHGNNLYSSHSLFRSKFIREKMNLVDDNDDSNKIIFGMWSDGCEAGGLTKGARSSVKIMTVHICSPRISHKFVFPVAIGKSKADHDSIRKLIFDDFTMLHRYPVKCLLHDLTGLRNVKFILGYTVQDRPEHAKWTGFMSHNGIFSSIPGYSCPISISPSTSESLVVTIRSIASCERCYLNRKLRFLRSSSNAGERTINCNVCNDWDITRVSYKPHQDYPRDSPTFAEEMISKKITFQTMRDAADLIYQKIYLHKWTKQKAEKYAQVECLQKDIVNRLYQHATNIRPTRTQITEDTVPPNYPEKLLSIGMTQNLLDLEDCMIE